MALNWVEDVVGHYYEIQGFLVSHNIDLPMPKRQGCKVGGHSDIDVLAIKRGEIVHAECQSWWGPDKKSEDTEFQRLKARFDVAAKEMFRRFNFLGDRNTYQIKKVFVTSGKPKHKKKTRDGPWQRLEKFCKSEGIDLLEIDTVIDDLIGELRKKYPPEQNRVGKEKTLMRFLIHLIHNKYIPQSNRSAR